MKSPTLALLAALLLACAVFAADVPTASQSETVKLVTAIVADDYKGFVVDGNVAFQGLKKDQFEAVVS